MQATFASLREVSEPSGVINATIRSSAVSVPLTSAVLQRSGRCAVGRLTAVIAHLGWCERRDWPVTARVKVHDCLRAHHKLRIDEGAVPAKTSCTLQALLSPSTERVQRRVKERGDV